MFDMGAQYQKWGELRKCSSWVQVGTNQNLLAISFDILKTRLAGGVAKRLQLS